MSFLSKASFWTHEATAPLLLQNHAFFGNGAPVSAATVARFEAWAAAMGVAGDRGEYEALVRQLDLANPRFPEIARVIERDVVRTFFHDDCRVPLSHFLHVCANEFQDYHQGLGYIASFLLLVLDEPTVLAMCRKMNSHADYMRGYWRHEAVALATDAHVFNYLLEKHDGELARHLAAKYVFPDTFCQKWFPCCNVHVLPFELLCDFLDAYAHHGVRASMQFGLALCEELRADLLAQKASDKIFELLRLMPARVPHERQRKIVQRTTALLKAAPGGKPFADIDFAALRTQMYDLKLRARMEAAAAAHAKVPTKKADADGDDDDKADDDDDDDDDDSDLEEGAECGVCGGMPDWYNVDLKIAVCGPCHDKGRAPHSKSHKVVEFDFDSKVHNSAPTKDQVTERFGLDGAGDDGGGGDDDDDDDEATKELADKIGAMKL